MLGYVRPSNEALLKARVLGAQDQHGCLPRLPLPSFLLTINRKVSVELSITRVHRGESATARCASRRV
jgi:hypothetical protein